MSSFYKDYKMIRTSNIIEFEDRMRTHLVEDDWEVFGECFHFNDQICQQLIKYNE